MKKLWVLLPFVVAVCISAQDAKVIVIAPEDSAAYQQAFDAQKAATAKLETVRQSIHDKYLTVEAEKEKTSTYGFIAAGSILTWVSPSLCEDPKTHALRIQHEGVAEKERKQAQAPPPPPPEMVKYRKEIDGWANGFEFSDGFKYIVPAAPKVTPQYNQFGNWPMVTPTSGILGLSLTEVAVNRDAHERYN